MGDNQNFIPDIINLGNKDEACNNLNFLVNIIASLKSRSETTKNCKFVLRDGGRGISEEL